MAYYVYSMEGELHYRMLHVCLYIHQQGDVMQPLHRENEQLKEEIQELLEQIRTMKEAAAFEAVVYKDSLEKQTKLLKRTQENVCVVTMCELFSAEQIILCVVSGAAV